MSSNPVGPLPKVPLDSRKKRNCASFGPQAHFRRVNPDGSVDLFAAPCDRWSCRRCAPRLRKNLVTEIRRRVSQHGLTQWLHLTLCHDSAPHPGYYARKLLRKWRALRDLYAKQSGIRLPFIWFKQVEKGWPHLHIFTIGLDSTWVETKWRRRTGAHEIELQDIDPATMPTPAFYSTRQIHANAIVYGRSCGRWWGSSQDIKLNVRQRGRGQGQFKFIPGPIDMPGWGYSKADYDIVSTDENKRPTHVWIKPKGGAHAAA
jgi:hypothetical protein